MSHQAAPPPTVAGQRHRPLLLFLLGLFVPYPFALAAVGLVALADLVTGESPQSVTTIIGLAAAVAMIWFLVRQWRRRRRVLVAGSVVGLILAVVLAWLVLIIYLIVVLPTRLA